MEKQGMWVQTNFPDLNLDRSRTLFSNEDSPPPSFQYSIAHLVDVMKVKHVHMFYYILVNIFNWRPREEMLTEMIKDSPARNESECLGPGGTLTKDEMDTQKGKEYVGRFR